MSESLVVRTENLNEIFYKIAKIEDEGGEIPTSLVESLERALTSQAEKVDSCAMFITRKEAEISWLDSEIDLIKAQQKRTQRDIDRMKELAKFVMQKENIREITGLKGHKFSLRDSYSVSVIDEKQVPAAFLRVTQKVEVNKADALKVLKGGEQILGLGLQKNENVVVK